MVQCGECGEHLTVNEIFNSLNKNEEKELVNLIENSDNDHFLKEKFKSDLRKLKNNYHSLTLKEIELIESISKRF